MSDTECEYCLGTGWYGNNGAGQRGNDEVQRCDMCQSEPEPEHCGCEESKTLRTSIATLNVAIIRNCELCTWQRCEMCPTKEHLDRAREEVGI
jgi:hypothetical protein